VDVQKILVPIDYSDDSQQALHWGTSLAGKYGAQLLLLHVIPKAVEEVSPSGSGFISPTSSFSEGMAVGSQPLGRQRIVIDLVDKAQTALGDYAVKYLDAPVPLQVKIAVGRPAEEILRVAREDGAGLIVMGTHGHTGLRHLLLGSVAEAVARQAHCPVFTVRPNLEVEA
jgi:nucleotide-binding universal stress UspA family protein